MKGRNGHVGHLVKPAPIARATAATQAKLVSERAARKKVLRERVMQGSDEEALRPGNVLGLRKVDRAPKSFVDVNRCSMKCIQRMQRIVSGDERNSMFPFHVQKMLCDKGSGLHV